MKGAVVKYYGARWSDRVFAHNQIFIEDEAESWVAAQVALHLNHAIDGAGNDAAVCIEEHLLSQREYTYAQFFKNINEDLVLSLFTAATKGPAFFGWVGLWVNVLHGSCDCGAWGGGLLEDVPAADLFAHVLLLGRL